MTHLIIAGHGKQKNNTFDPGATGLIKKGEHKYVVEDLFPAMKKYLPKGHDVVFFDKYKVSNYGNIVALAKQYKAKQITEIHFDAATPTARGGHVIIHSGYGPDKADLALRDAINNMVGVRYSHKGHKGISGRSDLLNVNLTAKAKITYRLIELGFGTNKTDADILTGKVDEYAKELVKAIAGKVNQVSKPVASKPTPLPPKKEIDEMTEYMDEKLPIVQREDAERLFKHAFDIGYFTTNHAPKVKNMTRRQFYDLKLSYDMRIATGFKVKKKD